MDEREIMSALGRECPVECKGIQYKKVSAVIYRKKDGRKYIQAELEDKGGNSVTIDSAAMVTEIKQEAEVPF